MNPNEKRVRSTGILSLLNASPEGRALLRDQTSVELAAGAPTALRGMIREFLQRSGGNTALGLVAVFAPSYPFYKQMLARVPPEGRVRWGQGFGIFEERSNFVAFVEHHAAGRGREVRVLPPPGHVTFVFFVGHTITIMPLPILIDGGGDDADAESRPIDLVSS